MVSRPLVSWLVAGFLPWVLGAACSQEAAPDHGQRVAISVAPLDLPGVTDAEFTLTVENGATPPAVVWTQTGLASSQYGDGKGSLSYVGTCDASAPDNTVTLVLDHLYATDAGGARVELPTSEYRNPTPLRQKVTCKENADVAVTFDMVILRSAQQGFFDVAVAFEDVFCSAKLDCNPALLFDGTARALTFVAGFACAAGKDQSTWLYLDDFSLACTRADGSTETVTIDPGQAAGQHGPVMATAAEALYEHAVYLGKEAYDDLDKCYWNNAFGVSQAWLAGFQRCTLEGHGTASTDRWSTQTTPAGAAYPVIDFAATIWDAAAGGLQCVAHPLNGADGAVATSYTDVAADAGRRFANAKSCGRRELTCVGDNGVDCDDGNPCTQDLCVSGIGCSHVATSATCDDHDACTGSDNCQPDGTCAGTALPGCGAAVCGDHVCSGGESCADCPTDCSPLGLGTCGASCDPTALPTPCGNGVCAPTTADGALATAVVEDGNGVCGTTCASDAECAGGATCHFVDGLAAPGVCAPASAASCVPGQVNACPGMAACLPLTGQTGAGVCVTGCFATAADACPPGSACLVRTAPEVHLGLCVGQAAPCDVVAQTGCPEAERCVLVGGGALAGSATLCEPATGTLAVGASCAGDSGGCQAGALCWQGACATTCDPSLPTSPCPSGGRCEDIGTSLGAAAGTLGVCVDVCGDGRCTGAESCLSCASDCGACAVACGDHICVPGVESCDNCPGDCAPCPACGDGACTYGVEDCGSCAADCGACSCGDHYCNGGETCETCPGDCGACLCDGEPCNPPAVCGDGACTLDETCESCPGDCGACVCGDGHCSPGETCDSCSGDCGGCVCGDGQCNGTEDCTSCAGDCGACACGDGKCTADEDCRSCEADCGPCEGACGDGFCQDAENCGSCPDDCGACPVVCGDGICAPGSEDCQTCPGDCPTCPAVCGDGICQSPDENCVTCGADCALNGLGQCGDACDPTAPSCPSNFMCTPSVGGAASPQVNGDGFCGSACLDDGACGGGVCAALAALGPTGFCVSGRTCDPAGDDCNATEYCVASAATPSVGYCVPGCDTGAVDACGGQPTQCVKGQGGLWSAGICQGQATPCSPANQAGCPVDQTCVFAGRDGQATIAACSRNVGVAGVDEPCGHTEDPALLCQPSLLCDEDDRVCRFPCDPAATDTCPIGTCVDVSGDLGTLVLGLCKDLGVTTP